MNFRFLKLQINEIIIARNGGVVFETTRVLTFENNNRVATIMLNVTKLIILPGNLSLWKVVDLRYFIFIPL